MRNLRGTGGWTNRPAASRPGVGITLDHPLRVARRCGCPGAGPCQGESGPGAAAPVPELVRSQPHAERGLALELLPAKRPPLAVAEVVLLLASTLELTRRTYRLDRAAGTALLLYAGWTGFATALSAEIARRNPYTPDRSPVVPGRYRHACHQPRPVGRWVQPAVGAAEGRAGGDRGTALSIATRNLRNSTARCWRCSAETTRPRLSVPGWPAGLMQSRDKR